MIFNELHTGFKWYDALEKQSRYKGYCESLCEYALIAPCNDVLPFQFRYESEIGSLTEWKLISLEEVTLSATLAYVTVQVPDNPALLAVQITAPVSGFDVTIATASWAGNVHDTIVDLADQINAGGVYSASVTGDNLFVNAPAGTDSSFNGTILTLGLSYGMFSTSITIEFAWATDGGLGTEMDITSCLEYVQQYTKGGYNYVQYNGGSLPSCMNQQMPCGKWYSTISDGTNTFYSEIFEVVQFEDVVFEQMKLPLFTAFRFYDSLNKQNRFKGYCESLCNNYILTSNTSLLPFQIMATDGTAGIQSFKLVGIDSDCEVEIDTTLIQIVSTSDGDRIIYSGASIDNLPCGNFYVVVDDGVTIWYSELIQIISGISDAYDYLQTDDGINITTDDGIEITVT